MNEHMIEKMIEQLKEIYIINNKNEEFFLDILIENINTHKEGAKNHKEIYFDKNKKIIERDRLLKIIDFILNKDFILYTLFSVLTIFLSLYILNNLVKFSIISILFLILYILSSYKNKIIQDLKLNKNGETWVRHTFSLNILLSEILKFIMKTDEYINLDEKSSKNIFESNIIKIYNENMKYFRTNMEKISEYITD